MEKIIIMSIKSEHLINILRGKKTLELRKTIPNDYKGWVYLYCTKSKPYLFRLMDRVEWHTRIPFGWVVDEATNFNGKVLARFWFDEHDFIGYGDTSYPEAAPTFEDDNETRIVECGDGYFITNDQVDKTCLGIEEINNYGKGKSLYAWKIKDLEIFNEPMNLSDFAVWNIRWFNAEGNHWFDLRQAPQSWQYAWTTPDMSELE